MDALADRWGVEPRTVGKTVFAELALRTGPHRLGTSRHASDRTTTTRRPRV
ncbi:MULTISPECIES: hypothetical protein [unclassified Streptomyces]|uniref:hypothetical protein n=1 Tax=Streptomyces sp. KhCrAH-43 TaxID=1305827 RepID=UPI000365FD2A